MLGQSTPFWSILLEERKVTRMVHVHQVTINSAAQKQTATLSPGQQCYPERAVFHIKRYWLYQSSTAHTKFLFMQQHTTNEQYHFYRTGSIQLFFYRHISQSPEYPKQDVNKMMNHQHSERVSLQFRLVQTCSHHFLFLVKDMILKQNSNKKSNVICSWIKATEFIF